MNAEWPTARLQMEDQPRPPGYRNRSSGKRAINVTPCHSFYYVLGDFAGV